jgi:hypothetical protein
MAQSIILKRSSLPGKVPDTGSLNIGEIAINTYDGKLFIKRSGNLDSIQGILVTNSTTTGSISLTQTGSFSELVVTQDANISRDLYVTNDIIGAGDIDISGNITGSSALLSGSLILTGSQTITNDLTVLGTVNARQFNISVISSSVLFESGSSRFGNTSDDTHDFTGSVSISGSFLVNGTDLAAGGAQGTYVFPNAFDFNVDDPTFGDFNSASLGYNLNFGDVETVGSPIHFVGGLSNLEDTTVIYPTSRSIDFVVDDRYVASITSQSFYTNTTFTASLQQGYTLVGNSSGVSYAVATSSFAGALPTGVVSGSSQIVSILSSLNTYTGSNDTTNTTQNTSITNLNSATASLNTSVTNLNSTTASLNTSVSNLNTATSSYETTGRGIVSGSSQITPLLPTGIVSSSLQILGGTGIISSSAQLENATITNLTITNLTTVNETASVIFSSGSNRFGDFGDDTQSFTGSVKISGSLTTIGSSTATSFSGAIAATNGVVSGSSQVTLSSTTGFGTYINQAVLTTSSPTFVGGTFTGALNVQISPQTSPVVIGNISNLTTFGMISFNGVYTNLGSSGIKGGGGSDNLYVDVPTGGTIFSRINNTTVTSVTSTGLAVTGASTFSSTIQSGGDISLMNSSGDISLRMKDSGGNADRVLLRQATTNDVYVGDIDANGGQLILRANGNNNLTIATTGAATFSSGISVGGATATTGGIQFPATQVAIASANNLDDYEEGTWTPGFAFALSSTGITYSVQAGTYTKIGRQVTVNGYIQLTSKGSSPGWAGVTGLPFTIANTNGNYSVASIRVSAITYTGSIAGQANINGTVMELNQTTEAGVLSDVTNTNFANNSSILLSLTYFV